MLKILIPAFELYDEINETFIISKEQSLQLEHSLVSLSKWESKWHKPFISSDDKTVEETIDYIRCMTITQNPNPNIYAMINNNDDTMKKVKDYIDNPMTATTFSNVKKSNNNEIITSEIIYYWMVALNIPFECQKWHLNKLITLINVCSIKNAPSKKMSRQEILSRNSSINEARKKQLKTNG